MGAKTNTEQPGCSPVPSRTPGVMVSMLSCPRSYHHHRGGDLPVQCLGGQPFWRLSWCCRCPLPFWRGDTHSHFHGRHSAGGHLSPPKVSGASTFPLCHHLCAPPLLWCSSSASLTRLSLQPLRHLQRGHIPVPERYPPSFQGHLITTTASRIQRPRGHQPPRGSSRSCCRVQCSHRAS
jgi:hypothetical protein